MQPQNGLPALSPRLAILRTIVLEQVGQVGQVTAIDANVAASDGMTGFAGTGSSALLM